LYRIRHILIRARSSLWVVPSLIVIGFMLLAFALIRVDETLSFDWLDKLSRLFGAGAEGSRGMLSAIATSMITVAGVTFSITIAALSQASSQYSPLILRNFMRDRPNQIVLGTFGGIFVYCLIVLRAIHSDGAGFVPTVAVTFALVHALIGIGLLLFFIHHIASVLQASSILDVVSRSTLHSIEALFPEDVGEELHADDAQLRALDGADWHPVYPSAAGYLQVVHADQLLRLATEANAVLRMDSGIGDFALEPVPVASVHFYDEPDEAMLDVLPDLFVIGDYRTIEQDAAFGIRQIVDMAVKSLSPAINDPTTACSCLDHLGSLMVRLAPRQLSSPARSKDGTLRLIAKGPTFEDFARLAFEQVRQNAGRDTAVIYRLIQTIELTTGFARSAHRLNVLAGHLDRLGEQLAASDLLASERDGALARLAEARAKLERCRALL